MDIVRPLPPSKGPQNILTIVHTFTCWPEAFHIPEMTATIIAKTFVEQYISCFGILLKLTTDKGSQFKSEFFSELT